MRCPVCHSDTTPALPRCTRCNARLDESTAQDNHPETQPASWSPPPQSQPRDQPNDQPQDQPRDQPWQPGPEPGPAPGTTPDPFNADPWPPEPWQPEPWPGGPGAPGGPGGPGGLGGPSLNEQTTSLSPEPWAVAPQPEMWRPPPPKRRNSALPYLLTALGVVILTGIALGIVFWPHTEKTASVTPQQSNPVSAQGGQSPSEDAGGDPTPSETNPDAKEQATRVDALLSSMMNTRTELGGVVTSGCTTSGLQRIRSQREQQLSTAEGLEVDGLDNGTQLKEALTKALRISVESNRLYLANAPGCPSDAAAEDVNSRASQAKAEVIQYWNPIAGQHGLSTRDSSSI